MVSERYVGTCGMSPACHQRKVSQSRKSQSSAQNEARAGWWELLAKMPLLQQKFGAKGFEPLPSSSACLRGSRWSPRDKALPRGGLGTLVTAWLAQA